MTRTLPPLTGDQTWALTDDCSCPLLSSRPPFSLLAHQSSARAPTWEGAIKPTSRRWGWRTRASSHTTVWNGRVYSRRRREEASWAKRGVSSASQMMVSRPSHVETTSDATVLDAREAYCAGVSHRPAGVLSGRDARDRSIAQQPVRGRTSHGFSARRGSISVLTTTRTRVARGHIHQREGIKSNCKT